jgi:hypothetical protein
MKQKKLLILMAAMFLIIINLVSSTSWVSFPASPTATDFKQVMSLNNGKAFAIDIANNLYSFDGSVWNAIASPNAPDYSDFIGCSKIKSTHTIFCVYSNSSTNDARLYMYDTTTETWDNYDLTAHSATDVVQPNILCTYDKDYNCYYMTHNTANDSENLYRFDGGADVYVDGSSTSWNTFRLIYNSNYKIIKYNTALGGLHPYEWNGVSWVDRGGTLIPSGFINKVMYYPSTNKGFGVWANYINFWNTTTGTFMTATPEYYSATAITDNTLSGASSNAKEIRRIAWYDNTSGTSTPTIDYIKDIDFNQISGVGWAVGLGGIIYLYDESGNAIFNAYGVATGIYNNPSIYNSSYGVSFWASPYLDPSDPTIFFNSNISINITGSNGSSIYFWEWVDVPLNYVASYYIPNANVSWDYFTAGTWNVELKATSDYDNYNLLYDWIIYPDSSNILTILVQNSTGSPLENVLVNVNNPLTTENEQRYTDSNGIVIFYNGTTGMGLIISADGTSIGYETKQETFNNLAGEQNFEVITLLSNTEVAQGGSGSIITARGCVDFINGVWLCGNLRTDGTSNVCNNNTDCISGKCNIYSQSCSNFNWSRCDNLGVGRGNYCVINETIKGFFNKAGNILLASFIFVIIAVIIIFFILLLRKKN